MSPREIQVGAQVAWQEQKAKLLPRDPGSEGCGHTGWQGPCDPVQERVVLPCSPGHGPRATCDFPLCVSRGTRAKLLEGGVVGHVHGISAHSVSVGAWSLGS